MVYLIRPTSTLYLIFNTVLHLVAETINLVKVLIQLLPLEDLDRLVIHGKQQQLDSTSQRPATFVPWTYYLQGIKSQ